MAVRHIREELDVIGKSRAKTQCPENTVQALRIDVFVDGNGNFTDPAVQFC